MMIPMYDTKRFCEIFDSADKFKTEYHDNGIPATISDVSLNVLYYLLYARYGNNPIANYDENQFKYKVWSIIWQFGPTWERKVAIQKSLREMTDADLLLGSKAIYNHALNPNSTPTTGSLTELEYINEQNVTNYKRGKLEGFGQLLALLSNDVTKPFIDKFQPLFKKFVQPIVSATYVTDIESEEEEDE